MNPFFKILFFASLSLLPLATQGANGEEGVQARESNTSNASSAHTSSLACAAGEGSCREVGQWEFAVTLGLGGRTNPIVDSDDQPILIVPQFSWYGEKFFLENFEFGYTLLETESHLLNIISTVSLDHIFFDDFGLGNFTLGGGTEASSYNAAQDVPQPVDDVSLSEDNVVDGRQQQINQITELDDRNIALTAGFEYGYYTENWTANIQYLKDISGIHRGDEFRISNAYQWQVNRNRYTLAAGVSWQSEELLDYYYGLDANEVSDADFVYEAEAGISPYLKFSWNKYLNERWSLQATFQYRALDASLRDSALVEERGIVTAFMGGTYHF